MVLDHDKDRDPHAYRRSLFYIQPQFEPTYWRDDESWDLHEAVFHGTPPEV
jgi:hypothetical protein